MTNHHMAIYWEAIIGIGIAGGAFSVLTFFLGAWLASSRRRQTTKLLPPSSTDIKE